jgi:mono/diheme cytochrome c family protein
MEAGGMRLVGWSFGVIGAAFAAVAALAQVPFPEGPNRELVVRTCSACHGLEFVMGRVGADEAGWAGTLDEMESNGLYISPDERKKIIEYLATYLGPNGGAPRPKSEPAT